jgi:hypothetical protein
MISVDTLRKQLQPKGTASVTRLQFEGLGYFEHAFIEQCLNELENKLSQSRAGVHEFTPLEILAIQLLTDSAK